jgi:translocation and assembly module TamA
VRGYQYQELGARQGAAVIGADSLVVGSAEYVHWFTNSWGGALFYDVGDADNDLFDVSWAKGYGAGARWRTLAGPLALDVAYGERDKQWRVHFTIAIAF